MTWHVERMVTQSNQGLYAIRTLRSKGSVAPIRGMLPGLPLWQEWHMPALPGGVCLTRAVGSASKQSSLKSRSRVYYRVITPLWWSYVMLRILSCSQPFSITLIMCFTVSCHLSANQHTICDSDPTIERSRSLKILFSKKLLSIEWY